VHFERIPQEPSLLLFTESFLQQQLQLVATYIDVAKADYTFVFFFLFKQQDVPSFPCPHC
jgi:hypothetical protein